MGEELLKPKDADTRVPLNRDRIVEVALDLLDEVGLDKLSTRRIADELGIKNASLYWHFRNKSALLDEMTTRLFGFAVLEPEVDDPGFDWVDWAAEGARAIRRTALSRRDGGRLMARARKLTPETQAKIARNVSILVSHGLAEADARAAFQTLRRFAVGSALQEQANAGRPSMVDGLEGDALFEFGLKLMTDSLRRKTTG